jgi:hypothetical protein
VSLGNAVAAPVPGAEPVGRQAVDPAAKPPFPPLDRESAQRRADRVLAFRDELAALDAAGVLVLPTPTAATVTRYHDDLLADLAGRFDVDRTGAGRQVSWGIRIAGLLGALALAASLVLLFFRIWGLLSTVTQVAILVVAPLPLIGLAIWLRRRDASGAFATLAGVLATACFGLDLAVLGNLFAMQPSPWAFLFVGALAFALAAQVGSRLLAAAGTAGVVTFLAGSLGVAAHRYWLASLERPESWLLAVLLCGAVARWLAARPPLADAAPVALLPTVRLWLLITACVAVYVLALGAHSDLPLAAKTVERGYEALGFVLAAALITVGVRRRATDLANLGTTTFLVFLLTKLYDWCWDLLPRYLFFLLVGAAAVATLIALQRVRRRLEPTP